jgi:hypothetical protein
MFNGVVTINVANPSAPVLGDSVSLDPSGQAILKAVVYDNVGGALYIGTSHAEAGDVTKIVKVSLNPFNLEPDVCEFDTSVTGLGLLSVLYDPVTRVAWWGTSTNPGTLISYKLTDPCPANCNNRGSCSFGSCTCSGSVNGQPWSGPACDNLLCPNSTQQNFASCKNGGICQNGTCACVGYFVGGDCGTRICPGDCSLQGTCDTSTYTCTCNKGYKGDDCGIVIPAVPPCPELTTCQTCFQNRACGWCNDPENKRCMYGDAVGPVLRANTTFAQCKRWDFDSCSDDGLLTVAWFFSAVCFIMVLIDMVSSVQEDYDETSKVFRRSGWRAARSAHTWAMISRMQLLVLLGLFNFKIPSVYHNFINGFRWTWAGFQGPFATAAQTAAPARRALLSFFQYATYTGNPYAFEFYSAFFYFAVIGIAYLVVLALAWLIGIPVGAWEGFHEKRPAPLPGRILYSICRLAQFAYLPLITLGAFAFATGADGGGYFLAVLTVGVLGLGLPIFLGLLVFFGSREEDINLKKAKESKGKVPNKLVFMSRQFKQRWGALYLIYRPKGGEKGTRLWFGAVHLLKLFVFGLAVGLSAPNGEASGNAQGGVLLAFEFIYLVLLLVCQPHFFIALRDIDIVASVANLISIGITLGLGTPEDATGSNIAMRSNIAIGVIVPQLIMMLVDILGFVKAWLSMEDIFSLDQCKKRLAGSKEEK